MNRGVEVITGIEEMRRRAIDIRKEGRSIGFVPTMGAFHEGHLSLMRVAREENDVVVVSVFVNPTQFGPDEDYERYPRDLERDKALAEEVGVEIIFAPTPADMYPSGYLTYVETERMSKLLCGRFRPHHFRGVTTVVAKLFNIIMPHRAYFGQKDYQQALIIKRMIEDLNYEIEMRVLPIVRDGDGVALSSRNTYLGKEEREAARILNLSLRMAEGLLNEGEREARRIINEMKKMINEERLARIEYISICDPNTLEEIPRVEEEAFIAMAVRIGETRLIDNLIWRKR
jgi:pantoate--beta-alanine ligase